MMRQKIATKIFLMVFMITAAWSVNTAEAKFVTKGLVSLWTFDRADIEGETVKDFWGNVAILSTAPSTKPASMTVLSLALK